MWECRACSWRGRRIYDHFRESGHQGYDRVEDKDKQVKQEGAGAGAMGIPQIIGWEDADGQFHVYTQAYTPEAVHDARYDCAIDKRMPLDRVKVVNGSDAVKVKSKGKGK